MSDENGISPVESSFGIVSRLGRLDLGVADNEPAEHSVNAAVTRSSVRLAVSADNTVNDAHEWGYAHADLRPEAARELADRLVEAAERVEATDE